MTLNNLFDVAGKVAVVTGGSSGIGAMMAQGLLENGAKVYITARKADRLHAAAEELSKFGECITIPGDMSSVEGIEAFVAEVSSRESKIDILINNAGANWAAPIADFPEVGWDKVMDINIKSIFFSIQKFLPLLKAAGTAEDPARVINIASINGIRNSGMPTYAYSASKSGVIHLTEHLATDLASSNVNVNAIAPGLFPSNMTKQIVENDGMTTAAIARIPRGRMGKPEDIAGTAIFLSSQASAWVTGHTIVLDGGMIATA
jgi:NAD(P)-dependent dehydrogenase (short-subunit alcohol dehydrogenase family)